MTAGHLANLAIHVGAGTLGLALGCMILAQAKGTARHRRLGRWFVAVALLVSASAVAGLLWFRFIPLFAVLSVLVPYQLVGGWHAARTRARGPDVLDAAWTLLATVATLALLPALAGQTDAAPTVTWATLAALALLLAYDTLRWAFPRRWFARLWRYEHAYKLVSTLSGMLSALAGNVAREWQPWSQLLPSVAGVLAIGYFMARLYRQDRPVAARPLEVASAR
jgi:uncharacterized membrane protein